MTEAFDPSENRFYARSFMAEMIDCKRSSSSVFRLFRRISHRFRRDLHILAIIEICAGNVVTDRIRVIRCLINDHRLWLTVIVNDKLIIICLSETRIGAIRRQDLVAYVFCAFSLQLVVACRGLPMVQT